VSHGLLPCRRQITFDKREEHVDNQVIDVFVLDNERSEQRKKKSAAATGRAGADSLRNSGKVATSADMSHFQPGNRQKLIVIV
jgi:hypothetical protein